MDRLGAAEGRGPTFGRFAATIARARELPERHAPIRWTLVAKIAVAALYVAALMRATHFLFTIPDWSGSLGIDYRLYMDATRDWMATGSVFRPHQLSGPYVIQADPLYPPVALWLFVPFTFLPAFLWWSVPIGLTVFRIWRWHPSTWSLGVIGFVLLLPVTQAPIFWGNPVMWLLPAVAWGVAHGWFAAFVLLKPSLALFALVGLRRPRRLAVGLTILVAACLPFGPRLWSEWVAAILNSNAGLAYNAGQIPLLLIPVVAWFGRRRSLEPAFRTSVEDSELSAGQRSWLRQVRLAFREAGDP
jgi:hypothetical protein